VNCYHVTSVCSSRKTNPAMSAPTIFSLIQQSRSGPSIMSKHGKSISSHMMISTRSLDTGQSTRWAPTLTRESSSHCCNLTIPDLACPSIASRQDLPVLMVGLLQYQLARYCKAAHHHRDAVIHTLLQIILTTLLAPPSAEQEFVLTSC